VTSGVIIDQPAGVAVGSGELRSTDTPHQAAYRTITLQNFILTQPDICTEEELFFRRHGNIALDTKAGRLRIDAQSSVLFDTYFNMFSAGKWLKNCHIKNLRLIVEATGDFEVSLIHSKPGVSWHVHSQISDGRGIIEFDLSHIDATGMLALKIAAFRRSVFHGARFVADIEPDQVLPKLAVSMTTFKREEAASKTIRRLMDFRSQFPFSENLILQVVDNGNSLNVESAEGLRYFGNKNLGGAGGFSRGLLEAEKAGFTHVLFTDDDADFPTESLVRTYAFLALAKDPRTAMIGAMINTAQKWTLWENGAFFDHRCLPQFHGMDLRDVDEVRRLEQESLAMPAERLYGGWWYFAFPVAYAKHKPFPFFVRGDDVSFSLANDFHQVTLAGVVSFQDGFTQKESPLTWYLDFRSHMVHHLTVPSMESSAEKLIEMFDWFIERSLLNFHYERAETVLLAMQHVMEGPEFFANNADTAEIRTNIKAMVSQEVLRPMKRPSRKREPWLRRYKYGRFIARRLRNGQRIPFFEKLGGEGVVDIVNRHHEGPIWGNSRLTYYDAKDGIGYSVQFDRVREKEVRQKVSQMREIFRERYSQILASYQDAYPMMTSEEFWRQLF